jgi:prepilin-type processing-associated H-X9-DG protein
MKTSRESGRPGFSRIELLICLLVTIVAGAMSAPLLLSARESARRAHCQENLRRVGTALHAYHDAHGSLPPAAVWVTSETGSMALHTSNLLDRFIRENWALLLLPFSGEQELADRLRLDLVISASENEFVRTAALGWQTCPSDSFNRQENPHRYASPSGREISFARGNYAINGGTNCFRRELSSTASVIGDPEHLLIDSERRTFRLWGNGIAGFNQAFRLQDFVNGSSTLVAVEEVRSGIHPIDPRGTWALGHIGSSVTYGHGVNGDDFGPNNPWGRSDDILGCARLQDAVGEETLVRENMPCVWYIDANQNATARSLHPGGANLLFLDGSVRFVSDAVDPGLWHVMHSRETPPKTLSDLDTQLQATAPPPDAPPSPIARVSPIPEEPLSVLTNSLGMQFSLLPAGEFVMGQPDRQNEHEIPPESPPHIVRLQHPFYMARREVTQANYLQVMGTNSSFHTAVDLKRDVSEFPVEQVTWFEADEFCQKLSGVPEERRAGRKYRLPTEAEWEYACRAGSEEPYSWSYERSRDDDSGEAAGIRPPLRLTPVGSYRPNRFGLFDLRGNVWEWCADWFDRDYYARSPAADPQGPGLGYLKVVRGSDWIYIGELCKINYSIMPPWNRNPYVGFRVVCVPLPAEDQ